ncbi:hypothetical protein DRO42_08465 [Candidatus Bathyarchaeota archaeon]|nr:MAG: hypothetical protein DRO42_08465 [Candidatus Bathyarchaeota archaeon]
MKTGSTGFWMMLSLSDSSCDAHSFAEAGTMEELRIKTMASRQPNAMGALRTPDPTSLCSMITLPDGLLGLIQKLIKVL